MPDARSKMHVLVVGAGIGGLTLAAFLERQGHRVTLIEKRSQGSQAGYVIGLWHNGCRILEALGLRDKTNALGRIGEYQALASPNGKTLQRLDFGGLNERHGAAVRFISRSSLLELLASSLSLTDVRLGVIVQSLKASSEIVEGVLSDGTSAAYDLVVGADGANSQVRNFIFGDALTYYPGAAGWAFLVPEIPDLVIPTGSVELIGQGKMIGFYPQSANRCGVFTLVPAVPHLPDPPETRISRLRDAFRDFSWIVPQVLGALKNPSEIFHDDFRDIELQKWHKGRIVLLGDAAHLMLPTTGQGASLAMEDAWVLSREIEASRNHPLEQALENYESRRKRRIEGIRDRARLLLRVLLKTSPTVTVLRDLYLRSTPRSFKLRSLEQFLTATI